MSLRPLALMVYILAGIKASNADQVLKANLSGIAVVSAILNAQNPKAAAAELKRKIKDFLRN